MKKSTNLNLNECKLYTLYNYSKVWLFNLETAQLELCAKNKNTNKIFVRCGETSATYYEEFNKILSIF